MTLLHLLGLPPRIQSRYIHGIERSTPERILKAVESVTGIQRETLFSKTRKNPVPDIRFIAMSLMRKHTDLTLKEVGAPFGRDYSTVIYAEGRVADLLETDRAFARMYNNISKEI